MQTKGSRSFGRACRVFSWLALLTALACMGSCLSAAPAPKNMEIAVGVAVGTVGFSDPPDLDGPWALYVTDEPVSQKADLFDGIQKCSAYAASIDLKNNTVNLYGVDTSGGIFTGLPFDKEGAYTVIIANTAGTQQACQADVAFHGGSALLSFGGMTSF